MRYRELGNSGLDVSVISFGAWQLSDAQYWGDAEDASADGAVSAALDAGVNLFDTAEFYGDGESEQILGRTLGHRRKDVFIASKIWPTHLETPAIIRMRCERSLQLLNTDYIDLYQIHWPPPFHVPYEMVYETLRSLRDEGKIRFIGMSNFGCQQMDYWINHGEAVSNQVGYNLLFRAVEHEIIPMCQRERLGVMAYMPIMQGLLAGKYRSVENIPVQRRRSRHFSSEREGTRHGEPGCEHLLFPALERIEAIANDCRMDMAALAVAWLLHQPGVTTAVVGARKPAQLQANLEAADIGLPQDVLDMLDEITLPLKDWIGLNADMWNGWEERRIR